MNSKIVPMQSHCCQVLPHAQRIEQMLSAVSAIFDHEITAQVWLDKLKVYIDDRSKIIWTLSPKRAARQRWDCQHIAEDIGFDE